MAWAATTWADFNGRLLRDGLRFEELNGEELCDVIYTMVIDDVMQEGVSRIEAREVIDKRLSDNLMRTNAQKGIKQEPEPFRIDPAMMAQLGIHLPTKAKS